MMSGGQKAEFVPIDDLRWQLVGQVAVTQAFLPLVRQGKGRILITGSFGGFGASPILGPYSMSKFAMEAFADSLRAELKPQGSEVGAARAAIATEISDKGTDKAQAYEENPPPGFNERYGEFFAGVKKFAAEGKARAHPPEVVVGCVIHALEARKPKTRYVMRTAAGQRKFLRRLPDRWRDTLILKAMGVTGKTNPS